MPIKPRTATALFRPLTGQVALPAAHGFCYACGRSHGATMRCLPDSRWFDAATVNWRDRRGRPLAELVEATCLAYHPRSVGRRRSSSTIGASTAAATCTGSVNCTRYFCEGLVAIKVSPVHVSLVASAKWQKLGVVSV